MRLLPTKNDLNYVGLARFQHLDGAISMVDELHGTVSPHFVFASLCIFDSLHVGMLAGLVRLRAKKIRFVRREAG